MRVDPRSEQRASTYTVAILAFSFAGIVLLYLLQRLQPLLPWSFDRGTGASGATGEAGGVEPGVAFNTAISFVTNTNWQSYSPSRPWATSSRWPGLTVQNFVSAAVGIAVAVALVRGFVRIATDRLGNFWVDLVRGCVRILLPIAFVAALVLSPRA